MDETQSAEGLTAEGLPVLSGGTNFDLSWGGSGSGVGLTLPMPPYIISTWPSHKVLTMYLAGAIRDNHPEDIAWRNDVITALKFLPIRFLNPLGGKTYHSETGKWTLSGIPSAGRTIVKEDFWCVDHSDIVVFNLLALAEKYPNIGSLIEFGRATKAGALIYSIVDPGYKGHGNTSQFNSLHPFLAENSSAVFPTVGECINFLCSHVAVLTGVDPHYVPEK